MAYPREQPGRVVLVQAGHKSSCGRRPWPLRARGVRPVIRSADGSISEVNGSVNEDHRYGLNS